MDNSLEIEEQAGAWLAKRDGGEWSAEEQARFARWLGASTAHRVAFLRLEEMWDRALRLQALGAGATPGAVPSSDDWHNSPFFEEHRASSGTERVAADSGALTDAETEKPSAIKRIRRLGLQVGVAAGIVLAIIITVAWNAWPRHQSFATPVGGIASVPMRDGSRITLNTDSKVQLALTDTERRVDLKQGEAFFEVAKDPVRPFVVVAGSKRVTAVGTQFSVRRVGDEVSVFVSDGRVRVEDSVKAGSADANVLVSPGGIVRAGSKVMVLQENAASAVEDHLSWRSGYLVFREVPLAQAVAEFNRYNEQKIAIQDPAVETIRVSGKIRATNFDAFLRLVEDGLAVRVRRLDGRIVLTGSK
jgi:transmembrane sensor